MVGVVPVVVVPGFALAALAQPAETGSLGCQRLVEERSPDAEIQVIPMESLDNIFILEWQTSLGLSGSCRVNQDGIVVEFSEQYSVPRGERPIETIVLFETDRYVVRIIRQNGQLAMNIYNKSTDRVELRAIPVQATDSDEGTTYSNPAGAINYAATVLSDGAYRLIINRGDRTLYNEQGQ
ncbi:MAG: hypothetical protein HC769_13635 [Cyanobacteria bacterium CRU_2_1]|nr:hypothetical protein [Cyanobacteria bacterium CRU_2_1]